MRPLRSVWTNSAIANVASCRNGLYQEKAVSQAGSTRFFPPSGGGLIARTWTALPDCTVTAEASQYPAMPYLSPCALSQLAIGAAAGVAGGIAAAAVSGTSATRPAAAIAARARAASARCAGTQARAASTAPHGSTATISRAALGP